MDVEFADDALARLEADPTFSGGHQAGVVKVFRKRMQLIRAAVDERAFREMRSLHFEKLQGDRQGQYSMRLNDQWRLILTFRTEPSGKTVIVIEIVDYH